MKDKIRIINVVFAVILVFSLITNILLYKNISKLNKDYDNVQDSLHSINVDYETSKIEYSSIEAQLTKAKNKQAYILALRKENEQPFTGTADPNKKLQYGSTLSRAKDTINFYIKDYESKGFKFDDFKDVIYKVCKNYGTTYAEIKALPETATTTTQTQSSTSSRSSSSKSGGSSASTTQNNTDTQNNQSNEQPASQLDGHLIQGGGTTSHSGEDSGLH